MTKDDEMILCAYSHYWGLRSEAVQVGDHWVLTEHKDAYIQSLRQGVSPSKPKPSAMAAEPLSLSLVSIVCFFAFVYEVLSFCQMITARGDFPDEWSVYLRALIITAAAFSTMWLSKSKFTYAVGIAAMAWTMARMAASHLSVIEGQHGWLWSIWAVVGWLNPLLMGMVLWRFAFGRPSLLHFGFARRRDDMEIPILPTPNI